MKQIFVNLKRFEVPRRSGGVCPMTDPGEWIQEVMEKSILSGLGSVEDLEVIYFLPEALILTAVKKLTGFPEEKRKNLYLGCQGVFREDIKPGGNFGTFTTNLPATAAKNLGCSWSIIGHSEERRDKLEIVQGLTRNVTAETDKITERKQAGRFVDELINREVRCALSANLDVLLCVGETAAERGDGDFDQQQPRIKSVLKKQLATCLQGVTDFLPKWKLVIGYEPIWAIGPGKTPPGKEYIAFVSRFIKDAVKELYGFEPPVVYGGGLKEENAGLIGSIESIDGGLVALTRFTGEIGFEPEGLAQIIKRYIDRQ